MEIDFLGLNSKPSHKSEKGIMKSAFKDSAIRGADISLSLSTSSSVDFEGEHLNLGENKTWAVPIDTMISTRSGNLEKAHTGEESSLAFVPAPLNKFSSTTGFLCDLNEKPAYLRTIADPTAQPALWTTMHSGAAHVFHEILPDKGNHVVCAAGKSSLATSSVEQSTWGYCYTPTVAMARRATLARFLEKRVHRLTRTKTSNLTGKSLDATTSQAWNVKMK
ncbi:Hypothetical predicted protein [Olea europaea subsp. europaea]|uniref:Uncharacterized protein n=1 Tax=Olea europaea subsp. europaea TaxID=158383 RepID=A0A8S0R6U7_OLEEU|nr:Hypothetical predicted protein [Olea europaea subsp. europaea]